MKLLINHNLLVVTLFCMDICIIFYPPISQECCTATSTAGTAATTTPTRSPASDAPAGSRPRSACTSATSPPASTESTKRAT